MNGLFLYRYNKENTYGSFLFYQERIEVNILAGSVKEKQNFIFYPAIQTIIFFFFMRSDKKQIPGRFVKNPGAKKGRKGYIPSQRD